VTKGRYGYSVIHDARPHKSCGRPAVRCTFDHDGDDDDDEKDDDGSDGGTKVQVCPDAIPGVQKFEVWKVSKCCCSSALLHDGPLPAGKGRRALSTAEVEMHCFIFSAITFFVQP
jgi:hypothetical protein